MQYDQFTTEDFVLDEYFRRWVNGQLPPEDHFWETWLAANPDKEPDIAQAKFVLSAFGMQHIAFDEEEVSKRIERIIALSEPARPLGTGGGYLYSSLWFKIAAALVVVMGLAWYFSQIFPTRSEKKDLLSEVPASSFIEKINSTDHPVPLQLADGSTVLLQPGSNLRYPNSFAADHREVLLKGEAIFDITKNPEKPFLVRSNGLTTKVLGTSFSVRSYEKDDAVVVKVFSGRVSVLADKSSRKPDKSEPNPTAESGEVILTPNQMVVFNRAAERLTKSLIEDPRILVPVMRQEASSNPFNFSNTPVDEVIDVLEKSYGVKIIYDRQVLDRCTVTAPLGNESLYAKLDLICKVIRATYEVVDGQVIISSKGCQ